MSWMEQRLGGEGGPPWRRRAGPGGSALLALHSVTKEGLGEAEKDKFLVETEKPDQSQILADRRSETDP